MKLWSPQKELKIILILKKLSVKIGNSLIGEIGDSLISGIIYIKNWCFWRGRRVDRMKKIHESLEKVFFFISFFMDNVNPSTI